jgi:small subunit ribosomal protein S16
MRLTRVGAKKRPSYRVVVADSRAPRDGRHVDIIGLYDPMTSPATINLDTERAVKWLRNGAQPSDRVRILLRHSGVLKAHEEARLADKRARKEAEANTEKKPYVRKAAKAAVKVASKAASTVTAAAKKTARTAGKAATAVAEVAESAVEAVADVAEAVAEAAPARKPRAKAAKAEK